MKETTPAQGPRTKLVAALIINLLTFVLVCYCLSVFFTRGGEGNMQVFGKYCFMFFTVDSNILAALAGLILACVQLRSLMGGGKGVPLWIMALKYVGTVAVSVTFFTVVCFLLEAQPPLRFRASFLGLLPTFVYGVVYIVMVVFRRAWYDFYGFNMGGFWYLSAALMLIATYLLALVLWTLRRAVGKREREEVPAA